MKRLIKAILNNFIFIYLIFFSVAENLYAQDWKPLMDSEHPRVEAMNAVVDKKIYIFSGFTDFKDETLLITSKSEVFDPAHIDSPDGPWKQIKDMPVPVTHVGAVTVGKQIWFAGGFADNNPGISTAIVQIYDTETDSWLQGPPLPEPLASNALVKLGNKLHSLGGLKPDRQTDTGVHYVLDLDNQDLGWANAADLPLARNHLSAATVGGRIYAIGGQFGHDLGWSDQRFLHEYDPIKNSWVRKADLPLDRSHFEPGTITIDGKILIVGGRNRNDEFILKNITEYDPANDKWKELDPLPIRLLAPVSKIINNKLYVTHGGDTYKDPLNKAFVKDYIGTGTETLGFWPKNLNSVAKNNGSIQHNVLIYSFNNELDYEISTEGMPSWIKIGPNDLKNITDSQGKYLEINLDPSGLTPGTYTYTITGKTIDNIQATLPITFSVSDPNIKRINTGGPSVTFGEEVFEEDKYYTSGKSFTNPKVTTINNTDQPDIFLTERSAIPGENDFEYRIPVENGNYKVRLYFSEIYWGATGGGPGGPGKRIFNVNLEEGPLELEDFDINKEVGSMTALVKEFEVEVKDKFLDLNFEATVDQPKISAIEIIPLYQDLKRIIFSKSTESISSQKNIEATFNNLLTTSDQNTTYIYLNASDENGKLPEWLTIEGELIDNYESLSGSEIIFSINSNRLLPGKYQVSVVASAVNYSSSEFTIHVEILPGVIGDPEIEISHSELIFSGIQNSSPISKDIIVSNFGPTSLIIESVNFYDIEGPNFKIILPEDLPLEIPAYKSSKISVLFEPQNSGSLSSVIQIKSNDPTQPLLEVQLFGLAAKGTLATLEPTLAEIIQTLGFNVNLGFNSLFSNPKIFPIGDEVIAPFFRKAGVGKVEIKPVARYSPSAPVSYGYFTLPEKVLYSELDEFSEASYQNQTLYPDIKNGIIDFNPGNKIFGIYVQRQDIFLHSTDSLNQDNHQSVKHAVRIYPVKDRKGTTLENHYILGFEDEIHGSYQDYVFLISNVRPIYCQSDLNISVKELIQPDCDEITGKIELEVQNVTSKAEFKLGDRGTYQEEPVFSGLEPGAYIIYVREAGSPDCESLIEFTINEPHTDLDFDLQIKPVSCERTSDGAVNIINIKGGTAPYSISWNKDDKDDFELTGLYAGSYSVTVSDAQGCKINKEFTVPKNEGCETYVIYREIFGNDSDYEADLENYQWEAFAGLNATKILSAPSDPIRVAVAPFNGSPHNNESINAGPSLNMVKGFLTAHANAGTNSLIFTEEYTIDLNRFNINSFSWFQGHNTNEIKTNLAIRIEGQWYISKKEFVTTVNTNVDPEFNAKAQKKNFSFTLAGTEWYTLDFRENVALNKIMVIDSERKNIDLPKSIISAFGLYTVLEDQGSLRFDSFEIRAEGDSSIATTVVDLEVKMGINDHAVVSWNTTNEKDSEYFYVERSYNDENYDKIGEVQGTGNNDSLLHYQFVDYNPLPGKSYYRIHYTDKEGKSRFTPSVILDVDPSNSIEILVFPNPIVNYSFQVEIHGLEKNNLVNFQLLDTSGKIIISSDQITDDYGHINCNFFTGTVLSPGMYTLVATSSFRSLTKKILIY
ncbi:hypothetical protein BH23BAC1_BH23BAC1_35060 [soil metagenome]